MTEVVTDEIWALSAELESEGNWVVRNDGAGKRIHFVCKQNEPVYHWTPSGRLARYTRAGAVRKAVELNRKDREVCG